MYHDKMFTYCFALLSQNDLQIKFNLVINAYDVMQQTAKQKVVQYSCRTHIVCD